MERTRNLAIPALETSRACQDKGRRPDHSRSIKNTVSAGEQITAEGQRVLVVQKYRSKDSKPKDSAHDRTTTSEPRMNAGDQTTASLSDEADNYATVNTVCCRR